MLLQALRLTFLLTPLFISGQQNNTSVSKNSDFSDSRFDINANGFYGKVRTDTTYYADSRDIASIVNRAVDRKNGMSGHKVGLSTEFYFNGQIRSQGNYQMYSLLYCCSPKYKRGEHSYKTGKWVYYYDTGQVMAMGEYKIVTFDAHTGIANQVGQKAVISEDWKFFNPDGNAADDKQKIIREMEYRPDCD